MQPRISDERPRTPTELMTGTLLENVAFLRDVAPDETATPDEFGAWNDVVAKVGSTVVELLLGWEGSRLPLLPRVGFAYLRDRATSMTELLKCSDGHASAAAILEEDARLMAASFQPGGMSESHAAAMACSSWLRGELAHVLSKAGTTELHAAGFEWDEPRPELWRVANGVPPLAPKSFQPEAYLDLIACALDTEFTVTGASLLEFEDTSSLVTGVEKQLLEGLVSNRSRLRSASIMACWALTNGMFKEWRHEIWRRLKDLRERRLDLARGVNVVGNRAPPQLPAPALGPFSLDT